MKQLFLTLTLLFNFTSFAQTVTIRDYTSNIPGDTINGDTIELSLLNQNISIPILIEVDSDSAFTIRYNLVKIDSSDCIINTLDVKFEPDSDIQNTCFSTNSQNPRFFLYNVYEPSSTVLSLNAHFNTGLDCGSCLHYRYLVSVNEVLKDSVDISVCGILGLNDDLNKLNSISIYPNPSSEFITIESSEDFSYKQVHVINNEGQIVLKNGVIQNNQLNISSFDQGSYYLLIYENEKLISKSPFVVIK